MYNIKRKTNRSPQILEEKEMKAMLSIKTICTFKYDTKTPDFTDKCRYFDVPYFSKQIVKMKKE